MDKKLADYAADNSLVDLNFYLVFWNDSGGIKMNAGCFDREIKDILISPALDKTGKVLTIPAKKLILNIEIMIYQKI